MTRTIYLLSTLLVLPQCLGFSVPQHIMVSRRKGQFTASAALIEVEMEVVESKATRRTQANGDLPPILQDIADERSEFNMNLGKAMDTLRKDMPEILRRKPDFDIYHKDITVIDPSGVRLTGLDNYKSSFAFFQTFIRFWFSSSSRLQYRMVYDFCRSSIRVSWNIILIPKFPLGRPLFIDGVSHYKLDMTSGKIIEHTIENLVMNNTPVSPPYGIFSLLQQDIMGGGSKQGVPVGVGA